MSHAIEVIILTRGTAGDDGPWVSGGGHRVHAPWTDAECEVKARVLRTLAARKTPPDGVAFVRQWAPPETPAEVLITPVPTPAFTPPTQPAVPAPRGRRGR